MKRNILYTLNSYNDLSHKNRMIHAAFTRYEKTKPRIKKLIIKQTLNIKHQLIQQLLNLGLKPRQIVDLQPKDVDLDNNIILHKFPLSEYNKAFFKQSIENKQKYILQNNRNKKYSIRTIQKIRKFVLK